MLAYSGVATVLVLRTRRTMNPPSSTRSGGGPLSGAVRVRSASSRLSRQRAVIISVREVGVSPYSLRGAAEESRTDLGPMLGIRPAVSSKWRPRRNDKNRGEGNVATRKEDHIRRYGGRRRAQPERLCHGRLC